jgi:1-acyl-sn-glycerol-3-phosphate acyltransferase
VITVSIGPPIPSTGRDAMQLTAEVESWIEAEVARLGDPRTEAAA